MPRRIVIVDPSFGPQLKELRTRLGLSLRDFASKGISKSYVSELETGSKQATPEIAAALDRILGAGGTLAALVTVRPTGDGQHTGHFDDGPDDELDAVELARRVAASDVGEETLLRLEMAVDDLATRYSVTPPAELIVRVRRHLRYVANLLGPTARKTLAEHRRLLVVGAWLSLLGATLHIDLKQHAAGNARLLTAASLARQAGHAEIHAWCYETQAWSALTEGDYRRALDLSRTAQRIAPRESSPAIQATAQEGRAWARLGQAAQAHDALNRVGRLVSSLRRPDRPEHHYRYDPDKATAYVATTLAWVGDPAAEGYAREVIDRLRAAEDGGGWPRRVAAARIDLGLALVAADKYEEAAASAQAAILSGRIVPSNHWRALEVVQAVEAKNLPEARHLREAYEAMRGGQIALPPAPTSP
jgi:transcriptional regulator with XRE-family HTH domain